MFDLLAMVVFAIFFFRAGYLEKRRGFENSTGLFWAALSLVISLLMLQWLKWGLLAMILGQIGLFIGITVFRYTRKS
jgi:hypothetical protein